MANAHGPYSPQYELSAIGNMAYDELVQYLETSKLVSSESVAVLSTSAASQAAAAEVTVKSEHKSNQPRLVNVAEDSKMPYVEIIEQPKSRSLRFRYQCEGRSAGSIAGENTRPDKKTSPTIKVHKYSGPLVVVVSCVTNELQPKPHPHSLVGSDCQKGVCTVKIKDGSTIPFKHLGIQCTKRKDVAEALKLRQEINVDPFSTGFDHAKGNIDLNVVKLCFQVFLPDKNNKLGQILKPVVTNPIYDKKVLSDLSICRIDKCAGSVLGGDEVFIFCEKIVKDDIDVKFQEKDENGTVVWSELGEFGVADIHKQVAMVFKTPRYQNITIEKPVKVEICLSRRSDGESSKSVDFIYMPPESDEYSIQKKKRKLQKFESPLETMFPRQNMSQEVKERLRARAAQNSAGLHPSTSLPFNQSSPVALGGSADMDMPSVDLLEMLSSNSSLMNINPEDFMNFFTDDASLS